MKGISRLSRVFLLVAMVASGGFTAKAVDSGLRFEQALRYGMNRVWIDEKSAEMAEAIDAGDFDAVKKVVELLRGSGDEPREEYFCFTGEFLQKLVKDFYEGKQPLNVLGKGLLGFGQRWGRFDLLLNEQGLVPLLQAKARLKTCPEDRRAKFEEIVAYLKRVGFKESFMHHCWRGFKKFQTVKIIFDLLLATLDRYTNFNIPIDENGSCVLLELAMRSDSESFALFKKLFSYEKVNGHCLNFRGQNVLHHAAFEGNLEGVKYLLEQDKGFDVNAQDKKGLTPLHCAAQKDQFAVVIPILVNGANPEVRDWQGRSALDYTAMWVAPSTARILLSRGVGISEGIDGRYGTAYGGINLALNPTLFGNILEISKLIDNERKKRKQKLRDAASKIKIVIDESI